MNEPASVALQALDALERRDYALGIGLALMVVTFFVSRGVSSRLLVPKDYTATILLGTSVLGGFGAALAAGVSPGRAALACVGCSSTAIAFWEAIAKHVMKIWSRRKSRRRLIPPRKFPTILALVALMALPAVSRAGERLEPGIVLVRPNGTEIRIQNEAVLLDRDDIARLDAFVEELQACRESQESCRRDHEQPRSDRKWVFVATIAGAFLAGFAAQQHVRVTTETVEP